MRKPVEGFLPLDEAVREVGLSRRTLTRRLRDGTVRVFRDECDRRRRLVSIADLERLTTPIELTERKEETPPRMPAA